MKITNFVLVRTEYSDTGVVYHATIDVTKGYLWWKHTKTVGLFRPGTENWRRSDTGDYVHHPAVRHLARVWTLRTGDQC